MLKRTHRGERGFTLIELMEVLAIMAILVAIVVPNLTGFLGRGKRRAYDTDRNIIQVSVDAYYTDESHPNVWPCISTATMPCTITFSYLVDENLLREEPASSYHRASAKGAYTWTIESNGIVSTTTGFDGRYP